ncbi:MAG: FHA domain-containing protein [Ktedonobacteraceae bacterium]
MREIIALIVVVAELPIPLFAVVVFLIVVVAIFVGVILLFRRTGKKKGVNSGKSAAAPGRQPQGRQQGRAGGWNQAGTRGAGDNAWGQQQQPGGWGASPQQQPGGWGSQAPAQQQAANPWGSPSSTQQQPSTWGNASPSTPCGGAGTGGNQPAWDATLDAQQPAAPPPQDPWEQPPASSTQQGGPVWGTQDNNPAQQQQAPTSYGGSGSGQSWGQSNQAAPAPQRWGQPPQQQPSSTPSPATGGNQGMPSRQQGQESGSTVSHTGGPGNNDDRTILRATTTNSRARNLALEHLQFTAFHPRVVQIGTWNTLLVYAYINSALQAIHADAAKFKDELGTFPSVVDAWDSRPLTRGTQITIVPTCRGITFNPERISFTWLEDWHPAKFRFQADRRWTESIGNGEITIYGGPLIIASLKLSLRFVEQNLPPAEGDRNMAEVSANLYKRIFTSYSHTDTPVVLACRNAYKALGLNPIIDIDNLSSGQVWNAELMRMIDTSDLFQLFWSERSAQSQFVRQEWQYALQHYKGEGYIRPVYWEKPLVSPPTDLSHLHFAYILLPRLETFDEIPSSIPGQGVVRMEEGKERGCIYELSKRSLSIGRSRESDIFLENPAVSRLHASIVNIGNGNYALRDEGSANGTKVNGQMVKKYQIYTLREEDRIQIGQTVLVFSRR